MLANRIGGWKRMDGAEIAFVATAGATGLAVAVSAWAWRLKRALTRRESIIEQGLRSAETVAVTRDAAVAAFGDVRLSLVRDAMPVVVGDAAHIQAARIGLASDDSSDAAVGLAEALNARHPEAVRLLLDEGQAFDLRDGDWRVQGRPFGGEAWIGLSHLVPAERSDVVPGEAPGGLGAGLIADASPSPTWVVDGQGQLVWANHAWLTEVRAPSLEEAREAGAVFDRGADQLAAEVSRMGVRQEGFRWTAGDGRRRAWKIMAEPLAGVGGPVLVFAIDMTEAEETRDTLRRHVTAHDETLNHLADAVAIFGPSRKLAFHNTAFQTLFNLDPAWLNERPTHGELLDRLRQRRMLPEVIDYAGWKAQELEFYEATEAAPDDSWSLPDGRTLRVVRQPHPLGGILLIFSDITGELSLRSRFNAQLQVQTATLDKLNDAVAVFGSDGRLRLHNEAFETFWAVSAERLEAAGDFDAVAELCKVALPDAALWLGLKARVADPDPESRVAVQGEGRTTDGRIAAWQTRPLPDGATLVAFSDVTARRELEQALAQREAALKESQALKREFVGSVSYELRTPLTTIVGYSELLESLEGLPERSRQHAGAIRIAAGQLARSIDDVLDMAQIDAGEMELSVGDVRIRDLFAEAVERHRPRIEGRGATLKAMVPTDLPPVRADARRLMQAVDHLLENATRSVSEGGAVTLKAELNGTEVRIRVEDTGRGIPYHLQALVFDRFVKRERGGPGVGLALVKALVELHGGWAEVESEPGKGAAFILHLPLEPTGAALVPELALG
ncbi:PAS domain-containing sensor histidine kinase [Brevundimonas subvibrioides]|uniref:histidine kinase n=1 Tax=Brevundimonas subvibrioides (strain ATCC 15264 / DSM 4735 / LMG 14903 / NBRC 16000 / CB 81) TaxID=633149 RepID=D9QKK6_BRESC|nr:PAS domain-containing sensor histidine kinase [Brevundimonas subvibrioides]ADK99831.1 PAS/PAC sensor signal transduction histidine kinase [Brevundimonas subvibrioides ATCC 15264]